MAGENCVSVNERHISHESECCKGYINTKARDVLNYSLQKLSGISYLYESGLLFFITTPVKLLMQKSNLLLCNMQQHLCHPFKTDVLDPSALWHRS